MKRVLDRNINTPGYWDEVYKREHASKRQRVDDRRLQELIRWIGIRKEELGRVPSLLDVGCGLGDVLVAVKKIEPTIRYMGVDISTEAIEMCRRDYQNLQGFGFNLGSAERIPYPSREFDLVWCGETLEHTDDPDAAIRELSRVCGEGGLIALSTPYRSRNRSPEHTHEFEVADVYRWGQIAGELVFLDCRLLSSWLTMFAVLRNKPPSE